MLGECSDIVHFKSLLFRWSCAGLFLALIFQLHWPPWTHHTLSSLRTSAHAVSPSALFLPLVLHGWIPCLLTVTDEIFYLQIASPQALLISSFYLSHFGIIYFFSCFLLLFSRWVVSDSCNSVDCDPPSPSVHGISQARILNWLPFLSPGDLPDPGIKPASPSLAGGFFTTKPPGMRIFPLELYTSKGEETCLFYSPACLQSLTHRNYPVNIAQ